jgi:Cof subfamily protein (haloacid dehalogenase superfamily)
VRARLAAIDLDGTLLRSDGTISRRTRAALAACGEVGIDVVLVTARSPRSVRTIAADLGLAGIAICANGATIYDLDADEIVLHRPLPPEVAHRVVRGLRTCVPGIAFAWEHELRFGSEPAYEAQRDPAGWTRPDGSYPPCDVLSWSEPMSKLLARIPGADLHEVLEEARRLCGEDAEVTLTGETFVEFMTRGVSKQAALAELADERQVSAAQIVAFGDQLADAEMLRWAGLGVAVRNATPFALEAADEVTASNDEDGVALVLERLMHPVSGLQPDTRSSAFGTWRPGRARDTPSGEQVSG